MTNLVRVKKILMGAKKILMYFRKNTADKLTFKEELANGELEVVVKLVEVQGNPPADAAGRRTKTPDAGALKTPVSK